jgi:hypothetical protein
LFCHDNVFRVTFVGGNLNGVVVERVVEGVVEMEREEDGDGDGDGDEESGSEE